MKVIALLAILSLTHLAHGQNTAVESPITMNQLMDSLRIRGGNWSFSFATPVFARIKCDISSYPDAKETRTSIFVSDKASASVNLFFMDSPQEIGEMPSYKSLNERIMKIKLSNCNQTNETRLEYYNEKFYTAPWNQEKGLRVYSPPTIPAAPELNREYILNYYSKEGDPYKSKVTICFVVNLDDLAKVPPLNTKVPQTSRSTRRNSTND